MDTIKIREEINHPRRRFLGNAALAVAAAQLSMFRSANAEPTEAHSRSLRSAPLRSG
jgi:hypothetical protein